ncbi:MAG: signal peptidase II [Anaerolineaceae bacterium]|nr:MAG: signal peptidase II [Anaerolineaceae bacterium]
MEPIQPAEGPKRLSWKKIGSFLKTYWRDFMFLFLSSGVIVVLDQWTKAWVRANVPLGADWPMPASLAWLEPYARIRHTYNTGAAFGLFQQGGLIFAILAVIVSALIILYFPQTSRRDWWLRLALALQLGGALGNLVDRIRFGPVTDFISVGNFAIFNVADSCISVGVAILILGVWLMERKLKKEEKAKQLEATSE